MPTPMRHHIKTRREIGKIPVTRAIIQLLPACPHTNRVIHIPCQARLIKPPARPNRARQIRKRPVGDAPHVLLAGPEACFLVEDFRH